MSQVKETCILFLQPWSHVLLHTLYFHYYFTLPPRSLFNRLPPQDSLSMVSTLKPPSPPSSPSHDPCAAYIKAPSSPEFQVWKPASHADHLRQNQKAHKISQFQPAMSPAPPSIPRNKPSPIAARSAAKYIKATYGPASPPPNRPIPKVPAELPINVHKLFPNPPSNVPLRKLSQAATFKVLQPSSPTLPAASPQIISGPQQSPNLSTFDEGSAGPKNPENLLIASPVARLTSLLLRRQDLDAQLCTLEGILKTHNCPSPSLPAGTPISRGPLTGRLAGILPSSTTSLGSSNYSTRPSYSKPLAEFFGDKPFEVERRTRPAPLNPQTLQSRPQGGDQTPPQKSPHYMKTVEVIRESYQDTALRLAEVELEIELAYFQADRKSTRWKQEG